MKLFNFIKHNFFFLMLAFFVLLTWLVTARINLFRYADFAFGKFDLGNMVQMAWNTLHGRFMYLTDYFGTDLPRWAMSHVDPIILIFVPIFAIYQHPLTLVFSQFTILILSAFLVYKIACLELKSKAASAFIGISYLLYPALGYLNVWTGFHGVTAAVPFFFGAFYIFEKMYKDNNFTKRGLVVFWILLIVTMMGKEQLPLYIFFYALFIFLFRNRVNAGQNLFKTATAKLAYKIMAVSFVWFILAFFVIIPYYSKYRVAGYERFVKEMGLTGDTTTDVSQQNYFLSRYADLGDSYISILLNAVIRNKEAIKVIFGGDRIDNLRQTFEPVAYLPFAYPPLLVISMPDFLINYLTTADGVGTGEITNHRISMIVPILFVSSIYAIGWLSNFLGKTAKNEKLIKPTIVFLSLVMVAFGIKTSYEFDNPVYLWLDQAVKKRVFAAASDVEQAWKGNLKVGDVVALTDLDNKDVDCSQKIVDLIPDDVSVSGPDYLGAHLSMRKTYAIYPALYNQADYVIVDVFSRKISTILNVSDSIVKDSTFNLLKSKNYDLMAGCGNIFVFKRVPFAQKSELLPQQQRFDYPAKYEFGIINGAFVSDFSIPSEAVRNVPVDLKVVFYKKDSTTLDGFVSFLSFLNVETGEVYEIADLLSYAIDSPAEWDSEKYYIENINITFPSFLEPGKYRAFIGMFNKVKTRNIYLGDIDIK